MTRQVLFLLMGLTLISCTPIAERSPETSLSTSYLAITKNPLENWPTRWASSTMPLRYQVRPNFARK